MASNQICKHYVENKCNHGDKCKFTHVNNICRHHFFGNCKHGDKCKFSHEYKLPKQKNNKPKLIKKNTETFVPSHQPRDMTVCFGNPKDPHYNPASGEIRGRDVIFVPNLFCRDDDMTIYNKLLEEIKESGAEEKGVWKLWHGDSHMIADDHLNWKLKCPTFNMVIGTISKYFNMDVKATRFNWYRDSNEWKPYHHDAAAVDPEKAKIQNFTVGVSFGLTRNAAFEHAKTKTTVEFPLTNGSVYCFANLVNVEWRHGIPQLPPDQFSEEGRISIIAWGHVNIKL
jgi:hypothetical protein